ncbi:MAG: hypothetical protein HYU28_09890 [Actinobacteria bacterium]|nr:hypothetical protein [Actinomycetota bacterium]
MVSDHTMETLAHPEPIDLLALAAAHGGFGLPGGGSALVLGNNEPSWLDGLPGCAGRRAVREGLWEAWTHPGWWFAVAGLGEDYRGMHGNPTTLPQVALVSGGHPAAVELADVVAAGGVSALDWAPTMAGLLGLHLPEASGLNLLPQ